MTTLDFVLYCCALGCFIGSALNLEVKIIRPINLFSAGVAFVVAAYFVF